mmetsp:Transcript_21722/g.53177  ORF Transcript_21722/g.53177 Transcript_21722/m.53177 type:complete len:237 (-) Transcript_21722:58-768(-)
MNAGNEASDGGEQESQTSIAAWTLVAKDPNAWKFALVAYSVLMPGMGLVMNLVPFLQEVRKSGSHNSAGHYSQVFFAFLTVGRLISGRISDWTGSKAYYMVNITVQMLLFISIPLVARNEVLLMGGLFLLFATYGGAKVIISKFVTDFCKSAKIHPSTAVGFIVMTACGPGNLIGSLLFNHSIPLYSGLSQDLFFLICASLQAVSLCVLCTIQHPLPTIVESQPSTYLPGSSRSTA